MKYGSIATLAVTVCAVAGASLLLLPEPAERKPSPSGDSSASSAEPSAHPADPYRVPPPGSAVTPSPAEAVPALPNQAPGSLASSGQREAALRVVAAMSRGPTEAACRAIEGEVLGLATSAPMDSPLWNWALHRARDCLRAPTPYRRDGRLLKDLAEKFPNHARVQELAGLQSYDDGRVADAAAELEEALDDQGTFESWQTLADAKLAVARDASSAEERAAALASAEDAMRRAMELAPPAMKPYALHTMARVQLEQGRASDAVQWASRALEAVNEGSGAYQAYMAAEMHVFAGQIFYRAGQRDTGIAYMDQGVAMTGTERQRNELRLMRDRFLQRYPPG